jgi:Lrp/AsnC family transcriptional regulator, regulator for asnA, asnC and gidA
VTITLDDLDRRVIAILQADGRRPYSAIAAELGVSEGTVRHRIQRLTDAELLQIVGVADPLRLGFGTRAMIGVKVRPGCVHEVCQALVQIPETSYVVVASGRYDVFVEVVCRDMPALTALLTERLPRIDGVADLETSLLLEVHKLAYGWGVGEVSDVGHPPDSRTADRRTR